MTRQEHSRLYKGITSQLVYDACVTHAPSDRLLARSLRRVMGAAGLRVRLSARHALGDQPVEPPAVHDSRIGALLIGSDGLADRTLFSVPDDRSWITIIAPGSATNSHAVPEALVGSCIIDFGAGLNDRNALRRLRLAVAAAAVQVDPDADPGRPLAASALKSDTIRSYDRIAEQYADQWCDHLPLGPLHRLQQLIPARADILDAGCGPGHHASYLAGQGHHVLGIDLSTRMIGIARKRERSVRFELGDAEALRYPKRSFDAVWSAAMPMHVPRERVAGFLTGLRRTLKPGGVIAITVPTGTTPEVADSGIDRRFFENYLHAAEIAELLGSAGLQVIDDDHTVTTRNTHEMDFEVRWSTLFACVTKPEDVK